MIIQEDNLPSKIKIAQETDNSIKQTKAYLKKKNCMKQNYLNKLMAMNKLSFFALKKYYP